TAFVTPDHVARAGPAVRARPAVHVFVDVWPLAQFQRSHAHGAARMAAGRERVSVCARRTTGLGALHVTASCPPKSLRDLAPFGAIVARMIPPAVDDAIDLSRVRRALVIKLRHHGDVLMASPVFTVLKRAASHAEIDALVYRETAPMLERHPAISMLHT